MLAQCIPGCEGLDRVAPDDYAMRMKIGIASVSGRFDGKVRISEQNPPTGFRMTVEGVRQDRLYERRWRHHARCRPCRLASDLRWRCPGGRDHRQRWSAPDRDHREDDRQAILRLLQPEIGPRILSRDYGERYFVHSVGRVVNPRPIVNRPLATNVELASSAERFDHCVQSLSCWTIQ